MLHKAPKSIFLPYTSLFRSAHGGRGSTTLRRLNGRRLRKGARGGRFTSDEGGAAGHSKGPGTPNPLPSPDRKSTRLNSSHLVISYAVFCLKKKTSIITYSLV